jgi:hemoglobin/transferrin/lactoferrin receptor protein
LNIGIDGQLNNVKSRATRTNLNTAMITKLDTRYPDGINKMNYFGIYAQHLLKMQNGKLILNDGIRLQTISLHSTIVDNSFFNFPFSDIKQHPLAVTGNLGLVYMPSSNVKLTGNLSSGFRSPNLDDLTKIFESSSSTQRLVVSNPDIKPEYTYNLDIGIAGNIKNKVMVEITAFYTLFRNAITSAPFRLNGQDSIIYNGIKSAVYANQNVNKAYSLGFNARVRIDFAKNLSLDNTVTYTYGRYRNTNGTKNPLDHIPPLFGKSSFSYMFKKFSTEVYGMYNGWKKIKDYNLGGEDNQQYATPDGMPSWFTLNWKGDYILNKSFTIQAGVENIFDRNYRYFASGFSAPGRNYIFGIRARW